MVCPICSRQLLPAGIKMVESMDSSDGAVMSVQNTYQCRNVVCESFTEDYIWTFNGESFIMHHIERHREAA